jgi:hypothetical protein
LPFTDGAAIDAKMFLPAFPYINPPIAGSPNDPTIEIAVQTAPQVDGSFRSVPASFNAQTRTISVPRQEKMQFIRTRGDTRVSLGEVTVKDENTVQVKLAKP